jgi:hypothetical protein
MYARTLEDQSERLTELRQEEWGELGLGAVALGAAVVASVVYPPLALPLFLGGVAVGGLGIRALWRRWDLLEQLSVEPEAYVISDVLAYARREATLKRRRLLAARIGGLLDDPGPACERRVAEAREELEALASELADETLSLDPAGAVDCSRLLGNPEESPLLNPSLPIQALHARIARIRAGFRPAGGASASS